MPMYVIYFQLILLVPCNSFQVVREGYRAVEKYWRRRVTGCCELKRIYLKNPDFGFRRIRNLELCLEKSKRPRIKEIRETLNRSLIEMEFGEHSKRITDINQCVRKLVEEKGLYPPREADFLFAFSESLNGMYTYRYMGSKIEELRRTECNPERREHERKLQCLWRTIYPDLALDGLVSNQWKDLGFQNNTPVTDLRGAGFLGIECLLYLARYHNELAHKILDFSHHNSFGFPFACVSIQITYWSYHLVYSGLARTHFYNSFKDLITRDTEAELLDRVLQERAWNEYNTRWDLEVMETFYEFYVIIFSMFVKYWLDAKPDSIMSFNAIKKSFETSFLRALEDRDCILELANPVLVM